MDITKLDSEFKTALSNISKSYSIIDQIDMSSDLNNIQKFLLKNKKDKFFPNERLVFLQTQPDKYNYIDAPGIQLAEIQKLVSKIDISNCFILIVTKNKNIKEEIIDIAKNNSTDDSNIFDFYTVNGNYEKYIEKFNDTSCKKLWDHLYVGTDGNINPCCLGDHNFPMGNIRDSNVNDIINSETAKAIRRHMLNGYRPRACSYCWKKEDQGIKSSREPVDTDFLKTHELNETIDNFSPTYLDIRLNNVCNFKCRMCSEYFSSSIQKETARLFGKNAKLGHEQINLESEDKNKRLDNLNKILPYVNKNVEHIYFAGGEPLITEEHYKILDKLLSINHTNLKITYNTNLSKLKYKKNNVIDHWKLFDNVVVGASIDASNKVAEYIRHGTDWSQILENIHIIKNEVPHVDLRITSTVGGLNIENLVKLQQNWLSDGTFQEENFSVSSLMSPEYLSVAALPKHHKSRIESILVNHINNLTNERLKNEWQAVLSYMNNNQQQYSLDDFKQRNKLLVEHRKESFIDMFPDLKDLYN